MTEAPSPAPAGSVAASDGRPSPLATRPEPLDHVETWLFDLDNTLYPAACNLFSQVDRRMGGIHLPTSWDLPPADARVLQKRYFREHGTNAARADDRARQSTRRRSSTTSTTST